MSKQLKREKGKHLAFEDNQLFTPIMKKDRNQWQWNLSATESFCFELITLILMVINISSVWKMFLIVAFYSMWYFGSVWFSHPPTLPAIFFVLILCHRFDRQMLVSLMGKSCVSCNNEWVVIHGCVCVLQTKIYTNGATQCQWSTVRRSRLWQIEAGTYIILWI